MSFRFKTAYNALAGAWGGLIAWLILDLVLRIKPADVGIWLSLIVNGALIGMCIGVLVSSVGGLATGRFVLALRALFVGLITGILGGVLGVLAGEGAFQLGGALGEDSLLRDAFRVIGWAIFGIGIGIAEGMLTFSAKRFLLGGLGGLLGGSAGGLAFIAVVRLSGLQMTNRAVGFAILGGFIGLFVGLIPDLLKNVWLKIISSGPAEGREFPLDKRISIIGSANNCEVGLFGDPLIAPKHATIAQDGKKFVIRAEPGQTLWVNNAPVQNAVLQNDDQMQVGRTRLAFRRKGK